MYLRVQLAVLHCYAVQEARFIHNPVLFQKPNETVSS
jgi:hypothetical protein